MPQYTFLFRKICWHISQYVFSKSVKSINQYSRINHIYIYIFKYIDLCASIFFWTKKSLGACLYLVLVRNYGHLNTFFHWLFFSKLKKNIDICASIFFWTKKSIGACLYLVPVRNYGHLKIFFIDIFFFYQKIAW